MTPAAGALSAEDLKNLEFVAAGLVVFIVFLVASRVLAHLIGEQLHRRRVRADMVVFGRRVVYVIVISIGVVAALGFAVQSANVTLVGILLATVVAALGVQDLLKDYVSGYYVLLEHHIRVGDRIEFDGHIGTISEVKLRVSLLRTDDGDLLVVPNSELFTKPVTIYSRKGEAKKSEPPG